MPQVKLNTTTSIVDYLKSQGKPSDFTSRANLYKTSGLEERLGKYVGSLSQNTAFLKQLNTPTPTQAPAPITSGNFTTPGGATIDVASGKQVGATGSVDTAANSSTNPSTSAYDVLSGLGYQQKSSDQIAQEALDSPAFKLYQEKAGIRQLGATAKSEAEKQGLESKAAQLSKETAESFGRRGLFFSGMREEDIQGIAANLASSKLGVDRELATKLLEQDVDTRKEFLDQVATVAKAANDGNKEAIDQLNKAGYAVVGGQLVPTVDAQRFAQSAQQAQDAFDQRLKEYDTQQKQREFDNDVKIKQLGISAQNAITSQERNAILDQIRQVNFLNLTATSPGQIVNANTGLPAKLSETQRTKYAGYDNLINTYVPRLRNLLSRVTTGGVSGRIMSNIGTVPILQNTLSADQQDLVTTVQALANERLYTQSGAQINEQEMIRIRDTLPRLEYSNAQNLVQLNNLERTFREIYANKLRIEGLGIAGDTPVNPSAIIIAPDGEEVIITD